MCFTKIYIEHPGLELHVPNSQNLHTEHASQRTYLSKRTAVWTYRSLPVSFSAAGPLSLSLSLLDTSRLFTWSNKSLWDTIASLLVTPPFTMITMLLLLLLMQRLLSTAPRKDHNWVSLVRGRDDEMVKTALFNNDWWGDVSQFRPSRHN